MRLNIQVELEWLGEDGNLDEEVRLQIIDGVKRAISRDCLSKVEKEASKQIDLAIKESIGQATKTIQQKAIDFVDEWLEREVTVTDGYGDKRMQCSIKEIVKKNFEKTLEMRVKSDGSFDNYGDMRLIDYLTGKRIKDVIAKHIKGINSDIERAIKAEIENGIKDGVAKKFAEMVIQTAKANHQQLKLEKQGE